MSRFESYRNRFRFVRLERQDRILQVTIHRNGDSAQWSAFPGGIHEELGDAFYEIGRDDENLIVILTGAATPSSRSSTTQSPIRRSAQCPSGTASTGRARTS